MSSWYDAWADRYDERSTGVAADVPFYVSLAQESDGPLVELAVGTGRVAIPVAQATGRRVVGIDRSPAMLDVARERAEEAGGRVDCPARSLMHLETWHDKRRVFERVAASLRPGGRFAWNGFAFSPF